jgi:hypothetical protein
MIHEVDEALRELVRNRALPGSDVEVAFEAPTKDWAARRNAPTVNVYLYDIREDLRKRSRGMINTYDEQGKVESRHLPPRHIKLSYLLTAWTQRPEDEHRLLAALLISLLGYEEMPRELLTGSLAMLARPVALTVALPPPEDRSFADVWTALGGELKPSLDVVISAPVMAGQVFPAAPTASTGMILSSTDTESGEADQPLRHSVEYLDPDEVAAGETISGTVVGGGRGRRGAAAKGGKAGQAGGDDPGGGDSADSADSGGADGGSGGAAGGRTGGAAGGRSGGPAGGRGAGGGGEADPSITYGPDGRPMRIGRRRMRVEQSSPNGSTAKGKGPEKK